MRDSRWRESLSCRREPSTKHFRTFGASFDQEPVRGFVVGALGEFGLGEGEFEIAVEFFAPGVEVGPGEFAAFDGEELVAVGFDADGAAAFAQGGGASKEE